MGATGEETMLGLLAAAEFAGFSELAAVVDKTSELSDRIHVAELATLSYNQHRRITDRMHALGCDPYPLIESFGASIDAFAARTKAHDWVEAMAKTYVLAALGTDFYRRVAPTMHPDTEKLLANDVDHGPVQRYAESAIRRALRDQPTLKDRLSLYTRRLIGEVLNHTHRVAADCPDTTALLATPEHPDAWGGLTAVIADALEAHNARMADIGLAP